MIGPIGNSKGASDFYSHSSAYPRKREEQQENKGDFEAILRKMKELHGQVA